MTLGNGDRPHGATKSAFESLPRDWRPMTACNVGLGAMQGREVTAR